MIELDLPQDAVQLVHPTWMHHYRWKVRDFRTGPSLALTGCPQGMVLVTECNPHTNDPYRPTIRWYQVVYVPTFTPETTPMWANI